MKRNLLLVVMGLASVVALTGCEKKENKNEETTTTTQAAATQLSCSASAADGSSRITVTYDGGSIKKASISLTEKFDSEKEAKKEYEQAQKEQEQLNKNKGLIVNVSYSGKTASSSYTFTIADMDENAKVLYEELFNSIKDKNLDDAKSQLTSSGYTCK